MYHQNTATPDQPNSKYIFKGDGGKSEVVYDFYGNLEKDSEDIGTYNFSSPKKDPIGHFFKDMIPYYLWGNSEDDETPFLNKVFGS